MVDAAPKVAPGTTSTTASTDTAHAPTSTWRLTRAAATSTGEGIVNYGVRDEHEPVIDNTGMEQAILSAQGLRYEIGERTILDDVDLTVSAGQAVAITGPSGAGKTTLLMCLAGLVKPIRGHVHVNGQEITGRKPAQQARIRLRHIGIVYQFGELMPELTPLENVALPAQLAGSATFSAEQRAAELLQELGLDGVGSTPTSALSGGERQRVGIARALINKPAMILADEPTGSLDRTAGERVADVFFQLPQRHGCAVIVVTHNPRIAARADVQWELDSGKLMQVRL